MNPLQELRQQYSDSGLTEQDLPANPVQQFANWYQQAQQAGIPEANGFVLSTVAADNAPSQRTVLMKSFDDDGFVFYTNHGSRKGQQMQANTQVSMLFPWYPLHRQIIVQGTVSRVSDEISECYFHSRPRDSQIAAWASRQSEVLENREQLEQRIKEIEVKFQDETLPLPEFWGGYLIKPSYFEFWQGRTYRVHDRLVYQREDEKNWKIQRLSP